MSSRLKETSGASTLEERESFPPPNYGSFKVMKHAFLREAGVMGLSVVLFLSGQEDCLPVMIERRSLRNPAPACRSSDRLAIERCDVRHRKKGNSDQDYR